MDFKSFLCMISKSFFVGISNPSLDFKSFLCIDFIPFFPLARLDAIITNASGCGTMVKDYGHLAAGDPELADIAATISAMTRDITEYLGELPLETIIQQTKGGRGPVTYHSACSLQHGQSVHDLPMQLLRLAGFEVR